MGGGVWQAYENHDDLMRERSSLIPQDVTWVQQNVASYDPENNTITTGETGDVVQYDYLVVAAGLRLRYDLIPGALESLSNENCPVGSIYSYEFAHKMSKLRE